MNISRFVSATLLLAVLSGCSGSDRIVVPPDKPVVTIAGGDNQSAMLYNSLDVPLTVAVTSADGQPMPNVKVDWAVSADGGALSTDINGVSELAPTASVRTDAQGHASVYWILGATPGTHSVSARAGDISQVTLSAIAIAPPLVIRYDGSTWMTSLRDNHGARAQLQAVWGSSASDVFVGGGGCDGPFTDHFNGSAWGDTPGCSGGSLSAFTSVWGTSAADVFALKRNSLPPSLSTDVVHYDGQTWKIVYTYRPGTFAGLNAVWNRSPSDVLAVGDNGVILHFDGTRWITESSGTTQNLRAVWGLAGTGPAFAVGDGGTILRNDGNGWTAQTSGTTQLLTAICGASATDVFAVGGGGTILHYNGTTWMPQTSGTTQALRGVWESPDGSAFAVGDGSTILCYDGTSWTPQTTDVSMNFRGVWGSSPTNVFVVGAPR